MSTPPPMPVGPMLLTAGPPQTGPGWINEIKLDGARALARVAGGAARIQSRAGNDFTARFPETATDPAQWVSSPGAVRIF